MNKYEPAGIYIIRCTVNGACYVGKAKRVLQRLHDHQNKLRKGMHDIPLLQRDWNRHGKERFTFNYLPVRVDRLIEWEEFMIMLTDALETEGGYNRMLGQKEWSVSVRIRKSERKLTKSGKFRPLPQSWPDERIDKTYCETFCLAYQPIAHIARCWPIIPPAALKDQRLKTVLKNLLLGEFKTFATTGKQDKNIS